MLKQKKSKKSKKLRGARESYASPRRMSLVGFKSVELPDSMSLKLIYSDFRTLVSASNQGEYIYRMNSVYDPDYTGVGGQPDGFDLWKTMYSGYRVFAVDAEVEFVCTTALVGLCAIGATTDTTAITSAEEVAGMRHSAVSEFANGVGAKLHKRYYISEVLGWSDEAILCSDSCYSAVSTNPATQCFLHVATETGGATDSVNMYVRLTYYCRFETPVAAIDAVGHARKRAMLNLSVPPLSSTITGGATNEPAVDAGTGLLQVGRRPIAINSASVRPADRVSHPGNAKWH